LGFEDEICGAQLSIRPTGLMFSVWNKNCNAKEQISFLTERLQEILQVEQLSYASHANVIKNFHNSPDSEHIHPPKRRNKRRTSNPDPPTQSRLSPNGHIGSNSAKKPAFKGDGGGASWDDIISGKPKSELVTLPTGNIVKKIKSYEDVPTLQKSFSIKGEFSKSMGSVHHQSPQSPQYYTPRNDAKSKIYWYYRRKELKALKNNIKKSASATSIPEIREPEFGVVQPPSPKKSPVLVQRKVGGGGQKLLLQHIEEQQKKIQQQHRDQLDKQKAQNAVPSHNPWENFKVEQIAKTQDGTKSPQETKSAESSPRKYDITKKPQTNAPVIQKGKEKTPANIPKITKTQIHDTPVKSENLPVISTPTDIKSHTHLPEEDYNITESPTTHPTVIDHVTKPTPMTRQKSDHATKPTPMTRQKSDHATKPTPMTRQKSDHATKPAQTELTHPTISDPVTKPTHEQNDLTPIKSNHETKPTPTTHQKSDHITKPTPITRQKSDHTTKSTPTTPTDLPHPVVSDHEIKSTPLPPDETQTTISNDQETQEKNTIETSPKETSAKTQSKKPSSKAQNPKHLAPSKSPNTNTTQNKRRRSSNNQKKDIADNLRTQKVLVPDPNQKDQTQTPNNYIIALISIILMLIGFYLMY